MFFEAERYRFFRPLHSSQRELVAACLRTIFERLHSPAADYSHNLSREELKELLLPVVREHQGKTQLLEPEADEFNSPDNADPQQLTATVIRALLRDGWLEQFPDRHGLVTAFRFSRPGKLFAEAFWSLDRPSRSRQRNMRGCRNALEAAYSDRGDAHDIVDAYEYAEKVIEDLTDGIDYFQELVRRLVREASLHNQWDQFVEFLTKFKRDFSKQLTVESAALNRSSIRQKLERLRTVPEAKFQRFEDSLHEIAQWAVNDHTGPSVYDWLLDRIDDIVNAACESKQPGFIKAMDGYVKRVAGLIQQSMMLRAGQTRHAYLGAIGRTAQLDVARQTAWLERVGMFLAPVELRLLDPASFRLRSATRRRKSVTVSIQPRPSREARLESAMRRAESEAFSVSNEALADNLRRDLRLFRNPIRLSILPTGSAREVLEVMQAVEAVRNSRGVDMVATRLPTKVQNEFFGATDYEINFRK